MTHEISVLLDELHECNSRLQVAEAELESKAARLDSLRTALVAHIDWEAGQPEVRAFILRKQAEAVYDSIKASAIFTTDITDEIVDVEEIRDYAERLIQQADEIEVKE